MLAATLKNLPQDVMAAIQGHVQDAAQGDYPVPSLPHNASWPKLSPEDTLLLSRARTKRKRLESAQDNHRRCLRLKEAHEYKELLYGLAQ